MQSIALFIAVIYPLSCSAYYMILFFGLMLANLFDYEKEEYSKIFRNIFYFMILSLFGSCLYEIIF